MLVYKKLFFATYMQSTGKIYSDPAERFLSASITVNTYCLIDYDYDNNCFFSGAMSYRKKGA